MDYKNGKIYCIRNSVDIDIYIGSTCSPLSKRKSGHRTDMKLRPKTGSKLYQKMKEIGLDKFYIELLLEYPCENKEQLQAKEGEYIRKYGTLNNLVAGRSKKEQYIECREEILQKQKEYTERNREKVLERKREYTARTKDKKREYDKEYRDRNVELIKEKKKQQFQQRKERGNIKVVCEICGSSYTDYCKKAHFQTKKHQEALNNLNTINNVSLQTDDIRTNGKETQREEVQTKRL